MENIKVTIIHPSDPLGPKAGGVETFIKGFIKYAPENIDIEIIGISSDEKERVPGRWMQISLGHKLLRFYPLFFCKDENKKSIIPLSLSFTIQLLFKKIKLSGQVILFNRIEPAILYRNFKVPKFLIMHTDRLMMLQKGSEVAWRKIPKLYSVFERKVFSSLAHIYCVSENSVNFYLAEYPKEKYKFSLLPTFFDPEIFYPIKELKEEVRKNIVKENEKLPFGSKWVLFVGRLQEAKAPLRLVKTFSEYYKMNKESYFLVIGAGDLEQKTRLYVEELGISQAVHFLGYRGSCEIAAYYRAADVMILTSNFEGLPISVLESLACGTPVVSTDVGEIKKVVRNGFSGEVVNSFDPSEIARALAHVLERPQVYSKDSCFSSVADYTPQIALRTLYESINLLSREEKGESRVVDMQGVRYNNVKKDEALREASFLLQAGHKNNIFFVNIDCLHKAQTDTEYKRILSSASLVLPDGIGLSFLTRCFGKKMQENCNGSDFSPLLMAEAAKEGYSIFFLGAQAGVVEKAAEVMRNKIPSIKIVGTQQGYFNDDTAVINKINASGADILFVSMGVPLQEKWITKNRDRLDPRLCLGVGALFDYLSGRIFRAPKIIQKLRLEWLWRTMMEPKRLWKRYFVDDLKFFWLVLWQKKRA